MTVNFWCGFVAFMAVCFGLNVVNEVFKNE